METKMSCPPILRWNLVRAGRLSWLLQGGPIAFVTILALCLLPFLVHALVKPGTLKRQPADTQPTRLARLSKTISVRAAGRGNPTINLRDCHEVLTSDVVVE